MEKKIIKDKKNKIYLLLSFFFYTLILINSLYNYIIYRFSCQVI